jgi:signal peptidase II
LATSLKNRWSLMVALACVGLFLDWLTKYLVQTSLPYGVPHDVIGHYLQFLFVYNKGALFGFNPRTLIPFFPVNLFFFIFNTLAMIILILYYRSVPKGEKILLLGLAMIMPGALGNLLDRVLHPQMGVVDFIKMGVSENVYWPIYNFADVYVTIGIVLLLISFMKEGQRKKESTVVEVKGD